MLFFTGQQETEQCLLLLVQQVNMIYRTVVFVEKTIQPRAMHIKCQVFEGRPSEVIPVALCLHRDRLRSTGGVYTGFHA